MRSETHILAGPWPERSRFALRQKLFLAIVIPSLVIASIAAITVGSTHVDWQITLRVIGVKLAPFAVSAADVPIEDQVIIWLLRVPRVIVAAAVGAALAMAGTLMQGLFRNPLADPNIVGVGSGAVLGAVIAFASGLAVRSVLALPVAAFTGALFALMTIYALASRKGTTNVSALLLSGIALAALLGAISSLLLSMNISDVEVSQEIVFWMMGGLTSRTWTHVWLSAPLIVLAALFSLCYWRDLDLLLQGEEAAAALGVEVESTKKVVVVVAALLTGSAVAVAGSIAFVGLIVPHIVRIFVGPSHRALLPASALGGAVFLIVCDLLARTLRPPTEIRLGIITAAFGAPFFLFLLVRKYRELGY